MSSEDKTSRGNFAVDISDDAIEEALRAVERLEGGTDVELEILFEETEEAPLQEVLVSDEPLEAAPLLEAAEAAEAAAAPGGSDRALLQDRALLEEENARLRAQLDSLAADLEALRRRSQREQEETARFAIEGLLVDLIPILDNFDRAQEHAKQATDVASLAQGVEMTHRLFEETLRRFGVRSFSALGQAFDPEFHEAMQAVESGHHPPNTVVEEMVRGYMLHERLVRPAMVCVSTAPSTPGGDEGAQ